MPSIIFNYNLEQKKTAQILTMKFLDILAQIFLDMSTLSKLLLGWRVSLVASFRKPYTV